MPEAAGKTFNRRLMIIPIALDDLGAANPDLADLAARQLAAVRIHHRNLHTRTGQADTVDVSRGQFARHQRRRRRGLRRAIGIDQFQAGNFDGQLLDRGDRHRRTAIAADPPRREIVAVEIGLQQAKIIHRRHHHRVGDPLARGDLQVFRGLEFRDDDQRAGAARHAHDVGDDARDMGERHCRDRAIRRCQLQAGLKDHGRMDHVAMREHRALWPPGGAGRIEDHRNLFLADLGGRLRRRVVGQSGERRSAFVADGDPMHQVWNIGRLRQTS